MGIFFFWIILCFVTAAIASNKGRSAVGFFFLALFLSPLVGIIVALVVKRDEGRVEKQEVATGARKKCPFCAELIKTEAIVCRLCGRDVSTGLPVASGGIGGAERPFGGAVALQPEQRTAPSSQPSPLSKVNGYNVAIGLGIAAIIIALAWPSFRHPEPETPFATATVVPSPVSTPARSGGSSGNKAHDLLFNMAAARRSTAFTAMFQGSTEPCGRVTRTFFAGMEPKSRSAIWSVGCVDGNNYQITVKSDATGSTQVLSCRMLRLVAKLECFKDLESQR